MRNQFRGICGGDFTFAMIKPNAFRHGDEIMAMIQAAGFRIAEVRSTRLTDQDAGYLYHEHFDKPYFIPNCTFVASGPVVLMLLMKPDAITEWRTLMGATDSSKALPGTIRNRFGNPEVLRENAVHGSDSPQSAIREAKYFFESKSEY